jgi:hypothetical protein
MRPSSWWIPLLFAIAAAGVNFAVLRTVKDPIPLMVAKTDLKAGQPLREENMTVLAVTAPPEALQSILHQGDLGRVVQKTLNRDLKAGELVLLRDVRSSVEDITAQLQPNESTLTLSIPAQRVANDLRPGDWVVCLCPEMLPGENSRMTGAILRVGPFRLLGIDLPSRDRLAARKLTLAVRMMPPGLEGKVLVEPAAAAIIALRTGRGSDDRIQSVERYNLDEKGIGLPPVVLQPNEFAPNKAPVVNPVNPQPQPKGPAAPPIPGLPAAKPAAPGKDK